MARRPQSTTATDKQTTADVGNDAVQNSQGAGTDTVNPIKAGADPADASAAPSEPPTTTDVGDDAAQIIADGEGIAPASASATGDVPPPPPAAPPPHAAAATGWRVKSPIKYRGERLLPGTVDALDDLGERELDALEAAGLIEVELGY